LKPRINWSIKFILSRWIQRQSAALDQTIRLSPVHKRNFLSQRLHERQEYFSNGQIKGVLRRPVSASWTFVNIPSMTTMKVTLENDAPSTQYRFP
jgi:hypothetical protein